MPELTCFRLLDAESPAGPLAEAVRQVNAGQLTSCSSIVDPSSFRQIPSASFVYWVDEPIRKLFKSLPEFETKGRTARQGLATADDFRFVRCWWEVSPRNTTNTIRTWWPFSKGGSSPPFFANVYLVVNWRGDGCEIKENIIKKYPYLNGNAGFVAKNTEYYFRPGITWPSLPHVRGSFGIVLKGCIFGHSGPMIFSGSEGILADAALLNSSLYAGMLHLLMPRGVGGDSRQTMKYEVGYLSAVPLISLNSDQKERLEEAVRGLWNQAQLHYSHIETSHNYVGPAAVGYRFDRQFFVSHFKKLEEAINCSSEVVGINLHQLDAVIGRNYLNGEVSDEWGFEPSELNQLKSIMSHVVGLVFGRWRSAKRDVFAPYGESDEFPLIPPAMASSPSEGEFYVSSGTPGFPEKCEKFLREAWGEQMAVGMNAATTSAGFRSLADYLNRPSGFFSDHLLGYSGSRRQAPIYWPLSTKSGNFTIWVYYPKLDDQSLPKLIADVLSPKIRTLSQEIENRRATPGGKLGELEALRLELEEMRTDFLDLINRGYCPNQNDGVLITACPLAKYFRHAGFRKNLEACWKELARGDYDWSHLAMAMWPDRVLEVCKKDRSIAIAHGKEELCPAAPVKGSRGRKKATD